MYFEATPIAYAEQVLKLYDDNKHVFCKSKRMADKYYGQNGELEKLRNLFHAKSDAV
jgi:hypothetical protein